MYYEPLTTGHNIGHISYTVPLVTCTLYILGYCAAGCRRRTPDNAVL